MTWWEEIIDEDTATAFLAECSLYSKEMIRKHTPELDDRNFNHFIQNNPAPFLPIGCVVHSTQTRTVWDAIRSIAYGAHGAHFVVSGHQAPKEYPLLAELPAAILAPMSMFDPVPGNGYLSKYTWSIELRTCGKLRPWSTPFESAKPSPIFFGEEGPTFFKHEGKIDPQFYWWDDLWRAKFNGNARRWFDYFYEVPSYQTIASLVALIRILKAVNPEYEMDNRLIVPSNCVNGGANQIPHIVWKTIRHLCNEEEIELTPKSFGDIFTSLKDNKDEWSTDGRKDEAFIAVHSKMHSWRTNPDDGNTQFLLSGPKARWPKQHMNYYSSDFEEFGFNPDDPNFAARMLAMAYGIRQLNLDDVPNVMKSKLDKIKGY